MATEASTTAKLTPVAQVLSDVCHTLKTPNRAECVADLIHFLASTAKK